MLEGTLRGFWVRSNKEEKRREGGTRTKTEERNERWKKNARDGEGKKIA